MTALASFRQGTCEVLLFAGFAAVYTLPVWSPLLGAATSDNRLSQGAADALASPAVLRALARDLLTHLTLLLACYTLLRVLARGLARTAVVSPFLATLLVLLAGWVWLTAGNAVVFSHSNYSVPFATIANPQAWALSSAVLAACLAAALWSQRQRWKPVAYGLGAATAAAGGLMLAQHATSVARAGSAPTRNVIVIGIDSLSMPLLEREQSALPRLAHLLSQSTRFDNAYTPLGRTYPAWVTILSGHVPAIHGALFNLRGIEQVDRQDLISRTLKAQGYQTVYAIDERRFNNIDESFGFDRVVGPQAGALDFVLQGINDTPLTNLLLQTRAADWLLPFSRLNVAAVPSYDARGFVDEIGRASAGPRPLFLAVHFLSGHFPFATRHATPAPHRSGNALRVGHVEGLTAADAQVGWLMDALAAQGRLEDTLVILLSDHGEALGDMEPVRRADGELDPLHSYGHGANLLSEHQNRIVLATLHYRHGQPVGQPAQDGEFVSLLDVRPAIERFVRSGEVKLNGSSDCIPVETELRLAAAEDYRHLDLREVAAQGLSLYEIDDEGRLRLRESELESLIAKKDVGLRCNDRLTVFTPRDGQYRTYRLAPGVVPSEQAPAAADIQRIDAYRQRLLQAGAMASRRAARPAK